MAPWQGTITLTTTFLLLILLLTSSLLPIRGDSLANPLPCVATLLPRQATLSPQQSTPVPYRVTSSPFNQVVKGVNLTGGFMEIVEEERCSRGDLRMTCRSLKAFIFIMEAEYRSNRSDACGYDESQQLHQRKKMFRVRVGTRRLKDPKRQLRGNYIEEVQEDTTVLDLRTSVNRRCSGLQHCRYNLATDHPGAAQWVPAGLGLKYACIPETAVHKYCNVRIDVTSGGGFIKSPGYPLYYSGGNSCGWTFNSAPGQRILLTFYDLNIRSHEPDGSCVDVVRIRENGRTIFETCGSGAGIKVISKNASLTLDLVASARFYPTRGFFLEYQVLGCTNVSAPTGSQVSNITSTLRTFLCKSGTVFPDTKQSKRVLECKDGKWNESMDAIPACVVSSAVILKSENEHHRLSSLSGDNVLGAGVRIGRGEDAAAGGTGRGMDSAQSAMTKQQADYVVDFILPTLLIALLFVGNAIIVYIIFQYRKRKQPGVVEGEEIALRDSTEMPQV